MSDTIGHKAEGRWALPGHEFGWPVIAWVGALRYQEHRSVPEIHQALRKRGVEISERTVGHLLNRYDEVLAVSLTDSRRLREQQGRVILAVDGLQPDVGHEVLWVVRECVSGEIMLARYAVGSDRGLGGIAGGGAGWATGGGNGGGGDQ